MLNLHFPHLWHSFWWLSSVSPHHSFVCLHLPVGSWFGLALWPLQSNISHHLSSLWNISWVIMCHFPNTYRKYVSIWFSTKWIVCSYNWHWWLQVRLDLVVRFFFFPPSRDVDILYNVCIILMQTPLIIARGLTLVTLLLFLNQISLHLGHSGFHSHLWTSGTQGKWISGKWDPCYLNTVLLHLNRQWHDFWDVNQPSPQQVFVEIISHKVIFRVLRA